MNATTPEPITRDTIRQFLGQLSDEERKYAFLLLCGPILGPIKEKRAVYDKNGALLGDYIPIPKVQPGQKVGMTAEEREALSKEKFMTREEWKAEKARQQGTNEPNT